jgi:hypothetical protein
MFPPGRVILSQTLFHSSSSFQSVPLDVMCPLFPTLFCVHTRACSSAFSFTSSSGLSNIMLIFPRSVYSPASLLTLSKDSYRCSRVTHAYATVPLILQTYLVTVSTFTLMSCHQILSLTVRALAFCKNYFILRVICSPRSYFCSKKAVFWVVAPRSLVEVYQRFRGPCYLQHKGDETSMKRW